MTFAYSESPALFDNVANAGCTPQGSANSGDHSLCWADVVYVSPQEPVTAHSVVHSSAVPPRTMSGRTQDLIMYPECIQCAWHFSRCWRSLSLTLHQESVKQADILVVR